MENSEVLKRLMVSPISGSSLAGMSADQMEQTIQGESARRGQTASVIDAMRGRKLQREQQEQMERHYEHQRMNSDRQFKLMQDQDARQQFTEMFNMASKIKQQELEQRKIQMQEQLQDAQLHNNSLERKKLEIELGQLQKNQEIISELDGEMSIGPDIRLPKGIVAQNPSLLKVALDYNLAKYKTENSGPDLPTAILERNANADLIVWGVNENHGVNVSPEAAQADAVILDFYSNLSDPTQTLKIAGDSTALMSKMFDQESREELVQTLVNVAEQNLTRILQGDGPNVRADLERRNQRLPAVQGLAPAEVPGMTAEEHAVTDILLESVRDGTTSPKMALKYIQEAFADGEISVNVVRSFEGAFRDAVEESKKLKVIEPEVEPETSGSHSIRQPIDFNTSRKTSGSHSIRQPIDFNSLMK